MDTKPLLTITGPSASGKTEILKLLCKDHGFSKLISVTTRKPRPDEVEGQDYYFIEDNEFHRLRRDGQLVQEVEFNGNFYGTTRAEVQRVLDTGQIPAVIVEPTGVPQFMAVCQDLGLRLISAYVWCDLPVLLHRYVKRMVGEHITPEKAEAHGARLSSLVEESEKWDSKVEYDFDCYNVSSLHDSAYYFANQVKEINEQTGDQSYGEAW